MHENRKQPRKNLISYSQVFDLYGGQRLGYLADINQLGAMVIGEKTVTENTSVTLQIEMPEIAGLQIKQLTVPARVVWCQTDISPAYFNIGFEFSELRPEQADVIQTIIDTYEFHHDPPRYPFRASTK